jgi:hypothetical protein
MLSTLAMMRCARVTLVVAVIFSIAYVLITPDPTDDVVGIVKLNHSAKAQRIASLPLPQSPILAIIRSLLSTPRSATQRFVTSELLNLVCVCRC